MYIGRDFKRDIELDKLNEYAKHLRPNRSWIDLFSLSLSSYFDINKFDFTILSDNLSEDEVIIVDSHDDIFKAYQIYFWRKDKISDILPAIKCPSFKSKTQILKTSKINKIREYIYDRNHVKSILIENTNRKLFINLAYGDTIKLEQVNSPLLLQIDFFNKLKERYELWEIDDCACKPKKIRVWGYDFENFESAIDELEWISNINNAKLGMDIDSEDFDRSFYKYDTMFFNHSARWMSDRDTNLIFTGNTLAAVFNGNHYNFRLDQRTKESDDSHIEGEI